jgi:hypothetical protein
MEYMILQLALAASVMPQEEDDKGVRVAIDTTKKNHLRVEKKCFQEKNPKMHKHGCLKCFKSRT